MSAPVVSTHPLAEIIGRKLFGIEGVPTQEQSRMVARAIKAAVEWAEKVEADCDRLREALESIANNTCCEGCQEAARVARNALAGRKGEE